MGRISSVAVLLTRMVSELRGCEQLLQVEALRDGLFDFCVESEAWLEEVPAIDIVDGQLEYNLIPEYDAHIHRITDVWILTEDQVTDETRPDPLDASRYEMRAGDPEVLVLEDGLEPEADIDDALIVKAVLVPELNSLDIAEWFLNRYWRGIVARAKWIRMMDVGKRWSNPQRAAFYDAEFKGWIQKAKGEVTRAFKQSVTTIPM
jgi:hypothetical protein